MTPLYESPSVLTVPVKDMMAVAAFLAFRRHLLVPTVAFVPHVTVLGTDEWERASEKTIKTLVHLRY